MSYDEQVNMLQNFTWQKALFRNEVTFLKMRIAQGINLLHELLLSNKRRSLRNRRKTSGEVPVNFNDRSNELIKNDSISIHGQSTFNM